MSETTDLVELRRLILTGEARRIRRDAGLAAATVAADVRVTKATLNRWETGKVTPLRHHAIAWLKVLRDIQAAQEGENTDG